jgi:sec-independent protein translocase protein TatA
MVGMDFGDLFSPLHLGILLVVVLLLFGPRRLPELGGAVGKTIQSFRAAMRQGVDPTPPPADATASQPAAQIPPPHTTDGQ